MLLMACNYELRASLRACLSACSRIPARKMPTGTPALPKTKNPPASFSSGGGLEELICFAASSAAPGARGHARYYDSKAYGSNRVLAQVRHPTNLVARKFVVNDGVAAGFNPRCERRYFERQEPECCR